MSTHFTNDEFILAYYEEPELGTRRAHLETCATCASELTKLASVLDQVTQGEVPEPADDYEQRVWQRLAWRLPAEKKRIQTNGVMRWTAVAAVAALVFSVGLLIPRSGRLTPDTIVATGTQSPPASPVANGGSSQQTRDRILLVVVGDHFDKSERMLIELKNLDPANEPDLSSERGRAEELLASNRLYRQTARESGEEQVARLLDELEPVLMQIAHTPTQVTAEEVRSIQKRVEAKGLVFKLRVVKSDVRATAVPHLQQPTI